MKGVNEVKESVSEVKVNVLSDQDILLYYMILLLCFILLSIGQVMLIRFLMLSMNESL